ncbi:DNA double-strand break repair nuclease NurA [Proteinivorax tanatarense]|uniref:DNA double-strand break repair nuclease NurA n=1 Tax=Proteinivorax tanatarense TaxID=1260629 RepID=A0AAU7VLL1_9FIRM
MYDKELIEKLKKINLTLNNAKNNIPSKEYIREKLEQVGGNFSFIKENVSLDINLMGVDGSFNSFGANYPHQILVFRALAKTTRGSSHMISDVVCPMEDKVKAEIAKISENSNLSYSDAMTKLVKIKLASMELQVAVEAIKKNKPDVIFMDGSLIRYKIEDAKGWEELKSQCLVNDITIGGVIEEIGTNSISQKLEIHGYDRETLFNLFKPNEKLIFHNIKEELSTIFYRPSNDPHPVGMDCLFEQKGKIEEMVSLANHLTPKGGRGIPIWLDIVDNEVRITTKAIKALIENHLDEDIKRVFFVPKRDNRVI